MTAKPALDPMGLEAAKDVMRSGSGILIMGAAFDATMEAAISAYLAAAVPADLGEMVAELRDEATRLAGHSLDRGSADAGIAANLADEAAATIERLVASAADARRKALEAQDNG